MKFIFKKQLLKYIVYTISFFIFFISGKKLSAQEQGDIEKYINLNMPLADQLPKLDSLIEIAIGNHPTVKVNQALVGSAEARINLAKKSWSNLVRVYVDYSYGNQAILYASGSDLSNIANGYRTGANLSIPLSEVFLKKDRVKLQKQELEATFYKTKEMELTISNQVIEEYNSALLGQKLMLIRLEMQEKARTNLQQMEMEFNLGNLDPTSFLRNQEIYTIARSEYENARKNFFVAIQKLEILLGEPLVNIIK
ncbi:TolC family protein [Cyclobacterium amurskyense]|jgi:outer membrane protein TolC|uniref:Outer membrane efflux protein n=1 Tax=Cyclobacterium amurskyense TaxID=320787 RepID=A0A0H4PM86_9BACT|nr:TolC family protein [Cyclobacterium amurskyense]AKP54203.1 Outer membrane efflux protein [Cyclobacterium amurskyense]|tara:strand:+ start:43213 stop:43971 length:759 start_codon:yes stop_codon:yes gene_type:complete